MAKQNKPNAPSRRPQPPVVKSTVKNVSGAEPSRWEPAGWFREALIVLVVTALCYIPSLKNGFVNWDDDANILENPNLTLVGKGQSWGETVANIFSIDKGNVIGNYNPLPILTFAVEKAVSKGENNPWLIHFDNLLLHLLTAFFVFRLLLHLGIGRFGALAGALLFGIHPMRVESVAWATERKDVLFAVFFFAALMYYVRYVKTEDSGRRIRLYVGMLVLALLSLLSKVQAVTLPLSMLAIDYLLRRPLNLRTIVVEKLPFWLLSLAFGLINLHTLKVQGSTNDDVTNFNILDRLCIGAYSFCVYLYKLAVPYPMSPLYPYPKPLPTIIYASPLLFLAIVAGVVWLYLKDRRIPVFGVAFFFFNVMFLLQVFGAGQGFLADRFTYVPYFGFFALAAWWLDRAVQANPASKTSWSIGLGIVTALFGFWTVRQIGVWENGETLWSHVIKFEGKTNSLPYWNRGQYYRSKGDYDRSLQDYSQAVTINPKNPELFNSRGKTYFDMAMSGKYQQQEGDFIQKAMSDYNTALQASTDAKPKVKSEVLINRGAAHGALKNFGQALNDLNEGIKLDPENENGYLNRSLVYFNLGKYEETIADYSSYLKYQPSNANIHYERGMLRRSLNRNQEAIEDLTTAIRLDPALALAYLERARAYAQSGNTDAARKDYQRAQQMKIQLTPKDVELMNGGRK
ncbi:MAG: tetratricopeptide repeat protein [Saprospiraceae bacterium]